MLDKEKEMTEMKNYAIIGFGCAGYHAAKAIRKNDPDGRIVVYSDTADPPFNPMLSTYYASDVLPLEGTFPFGSMEEIVKDFRLELHSETEAVHMDAAKKEIELADGTRERFDSILVATGASAVVPASFTENAGRFFRSAFTRLYVYRKGLQVETYEYSGVFKMVIGKRETVKWFCLKRRKKSI